jgi:chain length determinant protein tyrosine kinase EpsG
MTGPGDFDRPNLLPEIPYDLLSEQARLLTRIGRLTAQQVARITEYERQRGISFAAAALELGFLRRQDLMTAISQQYSYPILSGESSGKEFSQELTVGHEPFGAAAEAIRSIRSSLVATAVAQGTRSFAIIAPRHGAGATYFASNIALAFAQMAMPTLLVDANLRNPRIAEMFGLPPSGSGLSHALRHRSLYDLPIVHDIIPGLSILIAGIVPPNPQELLSSAEFFAMTSNLEAQYGVVIYDTAAAMEFADASIVVARTGAAIIVARQHHTSYEDVTTLSNKFRAGQSKFVGTVMNAF